jgi:hypothetical protein
MKENFPHRQGEVRRALPGGCSLWAPIDFSKCDPKKTDNRVKAVQENIPNNSQDVATGCVAEEPTRKV